MNQKIKSYCDSLIQEFNTIPGNRKELLNKLSQYINSKRKENKSINLVYICTHNSRRSHFGQIWAHVAASYYAVKNVNSFSGGTEVTGFNSNAINALKRAGFDCTSNGSEKNTITYVFHDANENPDICFSKKFDDPVNPQKEFAAIMTCSEAEVNCPFIPGAELRIGTTYDDPKAFDNTPGQDTAYDERCRQIALETFYVFSLIE